MTQQAKKLVKRVSKTVKLDYLLYLPQSYGQGGAKWPLIIFLHGAGERGADLELVKVHGIPKIAEQQPDLPFVAVSPQCPVGSNWMDQLEALDALYREITRTYAIDRERVYLTGLSMGGYGTWVWGAHNPRRFAALVPICGGAPPLSGFPERIAVLKDVPIWAFHGAKDTVVPLAASQDLVSVLERVDGNVKFTIYPEAGHDAWTETYANPELYTWLLAQRRSGRR